MDALRRAIVLRRPPAGLIHHSDRGSQYCSHDCRRLVEDHGFIASMSGRGNCPRLVASAASRDGKDNAMVETVFKTIKSELIWRTSFTSRDKASKAIGQYIESFYNPRRRHSSLGYASPTTFELAFRANKPEERIALHFFRGGPVTVIRSWLGHVSLDTANHYARANLETKRKVLERVGAPAQGKKLPSWKRDASVLAWLDTL